MQIDYYHFLYHAKTKLNMSEKEFWSSTLYKINKLLDFYINEHSRSVEENDDKPKEMSDKWGRPIIQSTDF